jgi:hypothetical protein
MAKKLSAKQVRFFGTPRQKAALKAKRKNSSHRPRTKARTTPKRANPKHKRNAARKVITGYGSTVMNPRRKKRKKNAAGKTNVVFNGKRKRNLGAIYALTANPAKGRKKSMAKAKRKKASNPRHRHAGSAKRKGNPGKRHRRSNPGQFGSPMDWLYGGVGVIAGVVGTRALPQLVLGSSNTGAIGYLANAASTALLTVAAHYASKSRVLAASVLAGGAASILSRIIQDYSLLGSYSSQVGLGDYLMSDFLTPQTLANGMQTAALNKPSWASTPAPSIPVNVAGAGSPGMGDLIGAPLY